MSLNIMNEKVVISYHRPSGLITGRFASGIIDPKAERGLANRPSAKPLPHPQLPILLLSLMRLLILMGLPLILMRLLPLITLLLQLLSLITLLLHLILHIPLIRQ
jgi:hypothetical protein